MIVVSKRPTLFRTAAHFYNECGAYQLRAVLNAFGKDALPEELYWSDWMRRHDWSLPWLMPAILRRYGIHSCWHFWPRSSLKKRALAELAHDHPTLFVINSIVKPGGGLHWVSAWGYDEATDEFLCYDSKAPGASGSVGLPAQAGNTRYSTDLLLSRLPWRGTFALTIKGEIR